MTHAEAVPFPPVRFTAADAERASDEWGSNCGPSAIAAICGLTLDEVRRHMGDFESKGYTNPTLMFETLNRIGVKWRRLPTQALQWPNYGLVRIQWEGPWTKPGVPERARYRYTHWVGAARDQHMGVSVFDINAIANGNGWISLRDWSESLVPYLLSEALPRANGAWHITHSIEVDKWF